MAMEEVILVDIHNQAIGSAEKIYAHQHALLHRAFSVFVIAPHEQQLCVLLQRRALSKYHCGGLWTNTCCSHPRPDETVLAAAKRRMVEELGFQVELREIEKFVYYHKFDNGLTEHEIDHVLVGELTDMQAHIAVNPDEVMAYKWAAFADVWDDAVNNPIAYTPWFVQALKIVKTSLNLD